MSASTAADLRAWRDGLLDALAGMSATDAAAADHCGTVGELSHELFLLESDEADLDLAEEALTRALAAPGTGPRQALRLSLLGQVKAIRYSATTPRPGPELLDEAYGLLRSAAQGLERREAADDRPEERQRARALDVTHVYLADLARLRWEGCEEPDTAAKRLDEALEWHRKAVVALEPGSDEETALTEGLGYLYLRRGMVSEDPEDWTASASWYRKLLDAGRSTDGDLPLVRGSLGWALMMQGVLTRSNAVLEEARDQLGLAVDEAVRATGGRPEWAWEAGIRRALCRYLLWAQRADQGEAAAAEEELGRLLADDADVARLTPFFLDPFARLLFERASARNDAAAQDRAIRLQRTALDIWQRDRDGPVAAAAVVLASFQMLRYEADPTEERLRDAVRASALVLAEEGASPEQRRIARQVGGGARALLETRHGVPAAALDPEETRALGSIAEWRAEVMASLGDMKEGREFVTFDEADDLLPGVTRATMGQERLGRVVDRAYEDFRQATDPEKRSQTAVGLLMQLPMLDPHGGNLGDERLEELVAAALAAPGEDPEWRRTVHAAVGQALLSREMRTRGTGDGMERAIRHINAAQEAAAGPGGDTDGRGGLGLGVALARFSALSHRGARAGTGDDMTEAAEVWRELHDHPELSEHQRRALRAHMATYEAKDALRRGDLPGADRLLAEIRAVHQGMHPEDPSRIEVWTALETLHTDRNSRAFKQGLPMTPPLDGRPTPAQVRRAAAALPRDHRVAVLGETGIARASEAVLRRDYAVIADALELIQEGYDLADPADDAKVRYDAALGSMNCLMAELRADRAAARDHLDTGIAHLESALSLTGGPEHHLYAATGIHLGRACRKRGGLRHDDRARSRRIGLEALRGVAWSALRQAGSGHAAAAVADAKAQALEVAGWCLRDNVPADAVAALEACRGLALHASVTARTLPERLEAIGRTDLADEWAEASAAALTPDPLTGRKPRGAVPSSLRRRVLAALTAEGTAQDRLLDPPSPADIAAALRSLRQDALVYLVPADDEVPGTAVVVTSTGDTHAVPLPTLVAGAAALREHVEAPGGTARRDLGPVTGPQGLPRAGTSPLRGRLERVCEWAWNAAMRPLLEVFGTASGRPPRLVIVPMGELGLVPWHAAWGDAPDGSRRYALASAEFSYAASARLLCEVAAREPAARTGSALIVGNPTGDLPHAGEEADAVHRVLYPRGHFLGRRATGTADGAGTPDEVLEWLAGAEDGSTLHLACHAAVARADGRTAHLSLHGGELAAEQLTDAMSATGAGRLGLVVLAACRTHVSGHGHDEAFSLATAFLAAGARSVVGSLWPVPDDATSVLMYLTHHFLRNEGEPPARALRRAQLWMLDPRRQPPPGMPPGLARSAEHIDRDDLTAWAGFTHLGR